MRAASAGGIRRVARGAAVAIVVAACMPGPTPSPPPGSTGEPSSLPSAASTPAPTTGAIRVDPTLLDHLPPTVAGLERRGDEQTAAEIAASTDLVASVDAIAVALYIGPLSSQASDYAVVTLAHVRPGIYSAPWFRDWRDTYDAAVCEQAGGVDTGRSEVPVDGRTVHRATCVGGVVIHHVHLDAAGVIVSVQGAGPADVGRAIVDELTE